MRYRSIRTLSAVILALATWVASESAEAVCYRCDDDYQCVDACQNNGGKNQCSFRTACGSNGTCANYDCELAGSSCTGTAECAACSAALEECGIENVGASLIVPNGEPPPSGSWLEIKQRELKICWETIKTPTRQLPAAGEPLGRESALDRTSGTRPSA